MCGIWENFLKFLNSSFGEFEKHLYGIFLLQKREIVIMNQEKFSSRFNICHILVMGHP